MSLQTGVEPNDLIEIAMSMCEEIEETRIKTPYEKAKNKFLGRIEELHTSYLVALEEENVKATDGFKNTLNHITGQGEVKTAMHTTSPVKFIREDGRTLFGFLDIEWIVNAQCNDNVEVVNISVIERNLFDEKRYIVSPRKKKLNSGLWTLAQSRANDEFCKLRSALGS